MLKQRKRGVSGKVSCIIAGDQVLECLGLRAALDSASDIQVMAEARNRNTALRNACDLRPNVMVVHSFSADSNTLELIRDVASLRGPDVRVLLIAAPADGRDRVQLVVQVYRAGFAGFTVASPDGPARTGGPAAAAPDNRADGTEVR